MNRRRRTKVAKVVNLRENELVITTITAIYSGVVILTELVSKSVPTSEFLSGNARIA